MEADNETAVIDAIRERLDRAGRPIVVAIDGRSGAGKSVLAARLEAVLPAVVVPVDDFYAAHISDAEWDAMTPAQRATDVVDWRRLRSAALEPLRAGRSASWFPFDFEAGRRPDGTFPTATVPAARAPAPVVILDGAYSSRPELADLIDLTVLVDIPDDERYRRLIERDGAEYTVDWRRRWQAAEDYYFDVVRRPSAFDLIVNT